tara:strand:+ start:8164 stop:8298 length:135 start_codon:yes stop_codon:yes gene_type:complete
MIYLLGWGLLLNVLLIQQMTRYQGRFLIFSMLAFFTLVAVVRNK